MIPMGSRVFQTAQPPGTGAISDCNQISPALQRVKQHLNEVKSLTQVALQTLKDDPWGSSKEYSEALLALQRKISQTSQFTDFMRIIVSQKTSKK